MYKLDCCSKRQYSPTFFPTSPHWITSESLELEKYIFTFPPIPPTTQMKVAFYSLLIVENRQGF